MELNVSVMNAYGWFESKPCSRVRYTLAVHRSKEYVVGEKGSLKFYGLEAAKQNQIQWIVVSCSGRPMYHFELAKA